MTLDTKPVTELAQANAKPPAIYTTPCQRPIDITGRLSAGAVERNWAHDRISLAECGETKDALREFYDARDAALSHK